jgi:acetyl-CoA carboxylase carboxyl transferase subunit alpha
MSKPPTKIEVIPLERPLVDLETRIEDLRRLSSMQKTPLHREIADLEQKAKTLRAKIFSNLSPYETTQVARHPRRPNSLELIERIATGFIELHGDRNFLDDKSVVGGIAQIDGIPVVIVGHQKGRGTKDNIFRNFGMPRPEGYRKALRLMSMAERFRMPIVTFVDTPGAYPGVDAEERGQSEAIAKNILVMTRLKVPIVTVIVGEGGSGGALALAVANRVHMLEHGVYSVISPEGCASILMKDAQNAPKAATMLKITAKDALGLGVVDSVIKEPEGGAHRHLDDVAMSMRQIISSDLNELRNMGPEAIREHRLSKFLNMGKKFLIETPSRAANA